MNRIRTLRLRNQLKQEELSKIINVSQASLSGYESGKYEPDNKTLLNLSAYFNVTTDYLLGNNSTPEFKSKLVTRIPVLRYIQSEPAAENETETFSYEEINQEMDEPGEFFALKMLGDSMEPRIQDGDVLIIHKQIEIESGEVAAVLISGNDVNIKKIVKYESGMTLIPYNPKYDPVSYSKEDVINLPIIILGKAIELRGKC